MCVRYNPVNTKLLTWKSVKRCPDVNMCVSLAVPTIKKDERGGETSPIT